MEQVVTAVTPEAPAVLGIEPTVVPQDASTPEGPDFGHTDVQPSSLESSESQEAVNEPTLERRQPREIISQGSTPTGEILTAADKEQHAKSLSDTDLLAKVEGTFRNLRENLPYIREARDRFAQPGRRVPVLGNPTWTEWVEKHLGVGIRRVQQLLAGDQPKPVRKNAPKPSFGFAGLSDAEVGKIVERAQSSTPEAVSRLMYNAVVHQPEIADVRATVTRCLDGLSPEKQLDVLEELSDWVEGQIYDLEHPEEEPVPKRLAFLDDDFSSTPTTIIEGLEQQAAMEAATC